MLSCTISNAKAPEIKEIRIDSPKNWKISDPLNAPATLRMPTSRARFSLRAVLRFMKLIQAINNISAAIIENVRTVEIRPPETWPFSSKLEYKRHLLAG